MRAYHFAVTSNSHNNSSSTTNINASSSSSSSSRRSSEEGRTSSRSRSGSTRRSSSNHGGSNGNGNSNSNSSSGNNTVRFPLTTPPPPPPPPPSSSNRGRSASSRRGGGRDRPTQNLLQMHLQPQHTIFRPRSSSVSNKGGQSHADGNHSNGNNGGSPGTDDKRLMLLRQPSESSAHQPQQPQRVVFVIPPSKENRHQPVVVRRPKQQQQQGNGQGQAHGQAQGQQASTNRAPSGTASLSATAARQSSSAGRNNNNNSSSNSNSNSTGNNSSFLNKLQLFERSSTNSGPAASNTSNVQRRIRAFTSSSSSPAGEGDAEHPEMQPQDEEKKEDEGSDPAVSKVQQLSGHELRSRILTVSTEKEQEAAARLQRGTTTTIIPTPSDKQQQQQQQQRHQRGVRRSFSLPPPPSRTRSTRRVVPGGVRDPQPEQTAQDGTTMDSWDPYVSPQSSRDEADRQQRQEQHPQQPEPQQEQNDSQANDSSLWNQDEFFPSSSLFTGPSPESNTDGNPVTPMNVGTVVVDDNGFPSPNPPDQPGAYSVQGMNVHDRTNTTRRISTADLEWNAVTAAATPVAPAPSSTVSTPSTTGGTSSAASSSNISPSATSALLRAGSINENEEVDTAQLIVAAELSEDVEAQLERKLLRRIWKETARAAAVSVLDSSTPGSPKPIKKRESSGSSNRRGYQKTVSPPTSDQDSTGSGNSPTVSKRKRRTTITDVKEKLFGDGNTIRITDMDIEAAPDQFIRPREPLPWTVQQNSTTQMWVACVQTNPKLLETNNNSPLNSSSGDANKNSGSGSNNNAESSNRVDPIALQKSVRRIVARSEQEAYESALVMAPPRPLPFEEHPLCFLCKAKFAVFRRPSHCKNCGVCICSNCSTSWNSKMLPETYFLATHPNIVKSHTNSNMMGSSSHHHHRSSSGRGSSGPPTTATVCLSCDWVARRFQQALLEGDYTTAVDLYSKTGNVNLQTPYMLNEKRKKKRGVEIFYPVHMAILGGNLKLLKWLVEERCCPLRDYNARGAKRAAGSSVTAVAAGAVDGVLAASTATTSSLYGPPPPLLTSKGRSPVRLALAHQPSHVEILRYLVAEQGMSLLEEDSPLDYDSLLIHLTHLLKTVPEQALKKADTNDGEAPLSSDAIEKQTLGLMRPRSKSEDSKVSSTPSSSAPLPLAACYNVFPTTVSELDTEHDDDDEENDGDVDTNNADEEDGDDGNDYLSKLCEDGGSKAVDDDDHDDEKKNDTTTNNDSAGAGVTAGNVGDMFDIGNLFELRERRGSF